MSSTIVSALDRIDSASFFVAAFARRTTRGDDGRSFRGKSKNHRFAGPTRIEWRWAMSDVRGRRAIGAWIEANAYTIAGPCREVFLEPVSGRSGLETALVEVQFPVSAAA